MSYTNVCHSSFAVIILFMHSDHSARDNNKPISIRSFVKLKVIIVNKELLNTYSKCNAM